MTKTREFFDKLKTYLKAISIRWKAEAPMFFQTISDFAYSIYGAAILLQPDVLEAINLWLKTGLHPLPWLSVVSSFLACVAAGSQIMARLTANLAKLSKSKIEAANPTEPEIAETVKPNSL